MKNLRMGRGGLHWLWLLALAAACDCDGRTRVNDPSIEVTPRSVFFGAVGVGERASRTLRIAASSNVPLSVEAGHFESLGGGASTRTFSIEGLPLQVGALGESVVTVHFAPDEARSHEALLVLTSDDPERPRVEITLVGTGAMPRLSVTPRCEPSAECVGRATRDPPTLHFGPEPFQRAQPLPLSRLPGVQLHNDGEVPVVVSALDLEGPDAAAFTLAADVLNGVGPDGAPALVLGPGLSTLVPLRFTPARASQPSAAATLVVRSTSPAVGEVHVALGGTAASNTPPTVCANLVRVEGRVPSDHGDEASWAPLRAAPPDGLVDLSEVRDVRPSARDPHGQLVPTRVTLSAHSPGGGSACTSDVEDGRDGLQYRWHVLTAPADAPGLQSPHAASTALELGPRAGLYEVRLVVSDSGGLSAQRTLRFVSVPKDDLVVELSWQQPDGEGADVDLDLHLVRPTAVVDGGGGAFAGAFEDFRQGPQGAPVSGDVNGRAVQAAPSFGATAGFHWGEPGVFDDPRFGGDDTGSGALLETIALDHPENDPRCESASCRYGVYVHFFEDRRSLSQAPACQVTGMGDCVDGARCDCPAQSQRCVVQLASVGGPRTGAGWCRAGPRPTVSIFVRGAPQPLAVIPLEDERVRAGAPCELLHVADLEWPARTAPAGTAPRVELRGSTVAGERRLPSRFYGRRGTGGGLTCQPNAGVGPQAWYVQDP